MCQAQTAPARRKKGRAAGGGPDFAEETRLACALGPGGLVIGLDEVGRGPMAGPVVAGAAWLSAAAAAQLQADGLDDSKKLSKQRRCALLDVLRGLEREGEAALALGAGSLRDIDRLNILWASHLAMTRAAARLARKLPRAPGFALVDGDRVPAGLTCPATAIVRGDGASLSIAAAALVAKQARDRLMRRLALRYPAYGWDRNAGYGSAAHRAAILAEGLTPHHRRGFCRRLLESAAAREN